MKYNVHLYVTARVRIDNIEAESQEAAIAQAEKQFCPDDFFYRCDAGEAAVWDEDAALGYLVDEQGDEEFLRSRYHEGDGAYLFLDHRAVTGNMRLGE